MATTGSRRGIRLREITKTMTEISKKKAGLCLRITQIFGQEVEPYFLKITDEEFTLSRNKEGVFTITVFDKTRWEDIVLTFADDSSQKEFFSWGVAAHELLSTTAREMLWSPVGANFNRTPCEDEVEEVLFLAAARPEGLVLSIGKLDGRHIQRRQESLQGRFHPEFDLVDGLAHIRFDPTVKFVMPGTEAHNNFMRWIGKARRGQQLKTPYGQPDAISIDKIRT